MTSSAGFQLQARKHDRFFAVITVCIERPSGIFSSVSILTSKCIILDATSEAFPLINVSKLQFIGGL